MHSLKSSYTNERYGYQVKHSTLHVGNIESPQDASMISTRLAKMLGGEYQVISEPIFSNDGLGRAKFKGYAFIKVSPHRPELQNMLDKAVRALDGSLFSSIRVSLQFAHETIWEKLAREDVERAVAEADEVDRCKTPDKLGEPEPVQQAVVLRVRPERRAQAHRVTTLPLEISWQQESVEARRRQRRVERAIETGKPALAPPRRRALRLVIDDEYEQDGTRAGWDLLSLPPKEILPST